MGFRRLSGGRVYRSSGARYLSGTTQPHYCASPGCTRRGEPESVKRAAPSLGNQLHYCASPGCTRRGEPEHSTSYTSVPDNRYGRSKAKDTPRVVPGEPDPFKFEIKRLYSEKGFTLATILYPGCTNYEGQKTLLLKMESKALLALKGLDPHFLDDGKNGLLARFVPTEEGWELGLKLLKSML